MALDPNSLPQTPNFFIQPSPLMLGKSVFKIGSLYGFIQRAVRGTWRSPDVGRFVAEVWQIDWFIWGACAVESQNIDQAPTVPPRAHIVGTVLYVPFPTYDDDDDAHREPDVPIKWQRVKVVETNNRRIVNNQRWAFVVFQLKNKRKGGAA